MARKYFGTDGVRGQVGKWPITPEFILKLGWAAGTVLSKDNPSEEIKVLIGKDTRLSGYLVESALEAGLAAAGVNVSMIGPIPTPAVAYLTRSARADAGIVISASHNPFQDNGIKFFGPTGHKLADDVEEEIERLIDSEIEVRPPREIGRARRFVDAHGRYIEYCKNRLPTNVELDGMTIVVDCAHGAGYSVAPNILRELGATVHAIGVDPDGININQDIGSTKPEALRQKVLSESADIGFALDGDADRVLFCDEYGDLIDGDQILYIVARHWQQSGKLNGGVVGTLMTNLALELSFKEANIDFVRAAVGDRYVLAEMMKHDWILGGENSGHIIMLNHNTTGDGIIAALEILNIMHTTGKSLRQLLDGFSLFPQVMINVPLSKRGDPAIARRLVEESKVQKAVVEAESAMGEEGRILLRPSGTEPVIRVMAEGRDEEKVLAVCEQLALAVEAVSNSKSNR